MAWRGRLPLPLREFSSSSRASVGGLRAAPIPGGVKLHIGLAAANLVLAATAGILLGLDKVYHFLPGFVLANVFAHAHLAAVGWAVMMVVGVGYRLLPMVIPAKAPAGPTVYASAVLMEIGVLILFAALIAQSAWAAVGAILIVAGFACFAAHVAAMVRHRSKKPAGAPAVDFAVLHAAAAGISFVVACAIGLYLVFAQASELSLRLAIAYGVFGLVGFLAQMVVGMQAKLVPLLAWYLALADSGFKGPVVPPYAMPIRSLQQINFTAWAFAIPAIAVGFALNAIPLLSAGAWTLLAGVILSAAGNWAVARPALSNIRHSSSVPAKTARWRDHQHPAPGTRTRHLASSSSIFNRIRCGGNPSGFLCSRQTAALSVAARWHAGCSTSRQRRFFTVAVDHHRGLP